MASAQKEIDNGNHQQTSAPSWVQDIQLSLLENVKESSLDLEEAPPQEVAQPLLSLLILYSQTPS